MTCFVRRSTPWPAAAACCAAALCAASPGRAQDKDDFTLFNPTPRPLMRELETDRPDVTESPRTVDAGHLQLEMSFLEFGREGDDDEYAVLPFNAKLGLLNNLDLHLIVDPYVRFEVGEGDASGFGNVQLRSKLNLWGNDGGETALAVMPFVQLPTADDEVDASDDHVEGGLIVPFATNLSDATRLGLMAEWDVVYDAAEDEAYNHELLHTASLSRALTDELGAYVEYVGLLPFDDADGYEASAGTGMTYQLTDDVQLDAGVYIGLNDEAEDFRALTGISVRL